MFGAALQVLQARLSTYLKKQSNTNDSPDQEVGFPSGGVSGHINSDFFKVDGITLMMVNLEENRTNRPPDMWNVKTLSGSRTKVHPPAMLDLYMLAVSNYSDYISALENLGLVVRYFQSHRLFDHQTAPELSEDVERLFVELIPMSFEKQNEVWNSLRTHYLPSALFKVSLFVIQDREALEPQIPITTIPQKGKIKVK